MISKQSFVDATNDIINESNHAQVELVRAYAEQLEDEIRTIKEIERRRWENVPGNWRRER